MVQVQSFESGIRNDLEIIFQSRKSVKTKIPKALGANFYVRRSFRGKTGREGIFSISSHNLDHSYILLSNLFKEQKPFILIEIVLFDRNQIILKFVQIVHEFNFNKFKTLIKEI